MPDDEKTKLLWWAVGLLLTSVAANQGIQKNFTVRDDAFTGKDAKELKAHLHAHVKTLSVDLHAHVKDAETRLDRIDGIQQVMIQRMGECEAQRLRTRSEMKDILRILK